MVLDSQLLTRPAQQDASAVKNLLHCIPQAQKTSTGVVTVQGDV